MSRKFSRAGLARASAFLAAGVIASLAAPVPAAVAAVSAPKALATSFLGASTPILSWARSSGASEYQVQVDNDPGFGSPEYAATTQNSRVVPSSHLRPGAAHWRVRSVKGADVSPWVTSQFQVGAVDVPALTHPANGQSLAQPGSPPLLRWQTSRGAVSYTVEVDGDADFIGARTYTTQSTAFVVPDPLGEGDWYWRVTANKGGGIVSSPSPASSFLIQALPLPQLTSPNDTFNEPVEDVVLDWEPVAGAQTYDVQVALDPGFNNFAHIVTNVHGTRYSPPTTLNNDEFWWRVRAVDTAGLPTPWQASKFSFKREWPDRPVAMHPVGSAAAPGQQALDSIYYSWTPVQHASMYEVEIATNITFTQNVKSCLTPGTTFVPRFTGLDTDCLATATTDPSVPKVWFWRVRPFDQPYNRDGLPGVFSEPQAFTRAPRPSATGSAPSDWLVQRGTGLKVAMTGVGARSVDRGCVSVPSVGYPDADTYVKPSVCEGMSATPVLTWDRQPDMDYYVVWFAQDENFTTTEVQPIKTYNTVLSLDTRKDPTDELQLPESQSGRPYYWYVQPCREGVDGGCGPRPDSQAVGLAGAAAFQKASPAVTQLASSSPAGNDISFSWRDFHVENAGTWSFGESGIQSAKSYHIQVDTEPGFSAPLLDEATIDQATYTAAGKLYPEGTLFWRVQAIDTEGNGLTWSSIASVTKASPPVNLRSPLGGAAVAGSTPFEWDAQPYASRYTLEVYRNNDRSFSSANRVVSVTTMTTAYAPTEPIPADSAPYVWRVRRLDASGNPGPWSTTGSFVSLGAAPELLSPSNGSTQVGNNVLFQWSDVPGAVEYEFSATSSAGGTLTKTTVASAYAPSELSDGTWTWRVRSKDSAGRTLGMSVGRSIVVDGTAPRIIAMRPSTAAKPKSNLVAKFSEKVKGVSAKSMKLYVKGSKKALKAKVKLNSTGTKATLNPKANLKRGKTYLVKWRSGITDMAGNRLSKPKKWVVSVK